MRVGGADGYIRCGGADFHSAADSIGVPRCHVAIVMGRWHEQVAHMHAPSRAVCARVAEEEEEEDGRGAARGEQWG